MDMPLYPGDPLSPGWASEKGARSSLLSEATTLMKIPVLPISYADAQPLLANLGRSGRAGTMARRAAASPITSVPGRRPRALKVDNPTGRRGPSIT